MAPPRSLCLTKRIFVLPSGRYFPYGIVLIFILDVSCFLQKMTFLAEMLLTKVDDKFKVAYVFQRAVEAQLYFDKLSLQI